MNSYSSRVACLAHYSLTLDEEGRVWYMGVPLDLGEGQIGDEVPSEVIQSIQSMSLGFNSVWFVNENGEVFSLWCRYTGSNLKFKDKLPVPFPIKKVCSTIFIAYFIDHQSNLWSARLRYDNSIVESPVKFNSLTNICQIACGSVHALFLDSDGNVFATGSNRNGELGLGGVLKVDKPTIIGNLVEIEMISCGDSHSLLLSTSGTVFSFGSNSFGQLGQGDDVKRNRPTLIRVATNIMNISCGSFYSMLLDENRNLWTFGSNRCGQLGHGDTTNRFKPVKIRGIDNIQYISMGGCHTILKDLEGKVWGFGNATQKQLGEPFLTSQLSPIALKSTISPTIGIKRQSKAKSARK